MITYTNQYNTGLKIKGVSTVFIFPYKYIIYPSWAGTQADWWQMPSCDMLFFVFCICWHSSASCRWVNWWIQGVKSSCQKYVWWEKDQVNMSSGEVVECL